jgi:hypothetical protein
MLLHSLRALYLAPGGPGSIWKYLAALVTLSGVCERFACGFGTDLHFPDVDTMRRVQSVCEVPPGTGVLRLLVPGMAAGVIIDRRCVADRVTVTR